MPAFKALIQIIGVNPYVLLPEKVLHTLFKEAGKDKGKIPVQMKIDGHAFPQTLVKYSGHWRLYLNMPMRKAAGKDVGDTARFEITYDSVKREIAAPPEFLNALKTNPAAAQVFEKLRPSLQLEIVRYLARLKSKESLDRNIIRAIQFLLGKARFVGRDKP